MKIRHETISEQRDDVVQAKASLMETIKEIEETATAQFLEAFGQARATGKWISADVRAVAPTWPDAKPPVKRTWLAGALVVSSAYAACVRASMKSSALSHTGSTRSG